MCHSVFDLNKCLFSFRAFCWEHPQDADLRRNSIILLVNYHKSIPPGCLSRLRHENHDMTKWSHLVEFKEQLCLLIAVHLHCQSRSLGPKPVNQR